MIQFRFKTTAQGNLTQYINPVFNVVYSFLGWFRQAWLFCFGKFCSKFCFGKFWKMENRKLGQRSAYFASSSEPQNHTKWRMSNWWAWMSTQWLTDASWICATCVIYSYGGHVLRNLSQCHSYWCSPFFLWRVVCTLQTFLPVLSSLHSTRFSRQFHWSWSPICLAACTCQWRRKHPGARIRNKIRTRV